MSPTIAIEVVARALLWFFFFVVEVAQITLIKKEDQPFYFYLIAIVTSIIIFVAVVRLGRSALIHDMSEICFYDILVQIFGLCLALSYSSPKWHVILANAIVILKYARLVWWSKTKDGEALVGWPVFGLLGFFGKRNDGKLGMAASSFSTTGQLLLQRFFILSVIPLAALLHVAKFKLDLITVALIPLVLIPVFFKRVIAFLDAQMTKQAAIAAKLAKSEAEAEGKMALEKSAAELAVRNAELTAANLHRDQMLVDIQTKNAALRDAAHDLMQPVMKIQAEIVEAVRTHDDALRAKLGQALEARLCEYARLIKDTIHAAKITTQAQAPNLQACPLARLRSDTADELLDLAEEHGCELVVRSSVRYPDYWVLTDEDIFKRIMANLIGNAIRHSGSKWVLVTMRKRGAYCVVAVRDQGIGIEGATGPDHGANFAAFTALIKDRTRRGCVGAGHGIGINNVKQLCAGLGSEMKLISRPGSGAVFYFTLPLAAILSE